MRHLSLAALASQASVIAALSLGFSLTSHGAEPSIGELLSEEARYALTSIDGVPTAAQLEALIPNTVDTLREVALGSPIKQQNEGLQVRLRAIRALSLFPSTPETKAGLRLLLAANLAGSSGPNILLAQAAIESLGRLTAALDADQVEAVSDSLSHSSRDIRVAAARALRQIGAISALDALRERERSEEIPAVKYAIYEAIQALGANP